MAKFFLASVVAQSINKLDAILPPNFQGLKVAFVPTAADTYDGQPDWLIADRDGLIEKGFEVFDVDIKNKTKEELISLLQKADIICVGGGNSFYLLEQAKQSGFDEILKDFAASGQIYIGSSAGAVLVGPSLEPIKLLDEPDKAPRLKSLDGIGLVDFVVLPHYGKEKYSPLYQKIMDDPANQRFELIPITDDQAVIVDGSERKVV